MHCYSSSIVSVCQVDDSLSDSFYHFLGKKRWYSKKMKEKAFRPQGRWARAWIDFFFVCPHYIASLALQNNSPFLDLWKTASRGVQQTVTQAFSLQNYTVDHNHAMKSQLYWSLSAVLLQKMVLRTETETRDKEEIFEGDAYSYIQSTSQKEELKNHLSTRLCYKSGITRLSQKLCLHIKGKRFSEAVWQIIPSAKGKNQTKSNNPLSGY